MRGFQIYLTIIQINEEQGYEFRVCSPRSPAPRKSATRRHRWPAARASGRLPPAPFRAWHRAGWCRYRRTRHPARPASASSSARGCPSARRGATPRVARRVPTRRTNPVGNRSQDFGTLVHRPDNALGGANACTRIYGGATAALRSRARTIPTRASKATGRGGMARLTP